MILMYTRYNVDVRGFHIIYEGQYFLQKPGKPYVYIYIRLGSKSDGPDQPSTKSLLVSGE
jgi:hypothetical protein